MRTKLLAFSILLFLCCSLANATSTFVTIKGNTFRRNGTNYNYIGTNLWYAMNLGSHGIGGDRARLSRELDRLKAVGIRNVRILGGSEGPDSEPWRVSPSLQPAPGVYNEQLLEGLDFTLAELKKRDMTAVIMLNNFWEWSGGMAQYRRWAGASPIPYPPSNDFIPYTSQFYSDQKAMGLFNNFVQMLVTRKNSVTRSAYANDPTIMAWELANEPRGAKNLNDFNDWIVNTAALIKSLDTHHMVTTGVEGDFHDSGSGLDFLRNHSSKNIDYATLHVWVQNAGVYDPLKAGETYAKAKQWANELIDRHILLQQQLHKPVVLEEFGLARDGNLFEPKDPVGYRDDFFRFLFAKVLKSATSDQALSGANFWAWGGEGHPPQPIGAWWKPGDVFLGDPAHEHQGWYSIYSSDVTTLKVIQEYARQLNAH